MGKRKPIKYRSIKSVRLSFADKKLVRELSAKHGMEFSELVREGLRALQREGIKAA